MKKEKPSGYICRPVEKNCKNPFDSYGMICVHCNCCGIYGKGLKMWKARLFIENRLLKEEKKFDGWDKDEGMRKFQEKNHKSNLRWHQNRIKKIKERIKYFSGKHGK